MFKTKEEALPCPSSELSKGWADKLELLWLLWILEHGSECEVGRSQIFVPLRFFTF